MEFSVEQGKQGSLVWVQRKNGKWWPGKLQLPSSSSRTAVRLLGRERGSLEWFNLEKSTRVKAFRSVEFVDFIRRVESSHTSRYSKSEKYAHHEDAVQHALLIEKQEQETGHETQGDLRQGAFRQAKRRRCFYQQPLESIDYVHQSVLHSEMLRMEESSDQSDVTESSFQDSDSSGEKAYTMLFDVEVTVQANSRKEHVPLVSLMSKSNNVAIIGHPLEVEVIESTKRSTNHRLDGLTWKTAKRTKVSYIPIPKSSASSDLEGNANAAVQAKEEPLLKPVMKGTMLSDVASCVPVNRIFSRLISELYT